MEEARKANAAKVAQAQAEYQIVSARLHAVGWRVLGEGCRSRVHVGQGLVQDCSRLVGGRAKVGHVGCVVRVGLQGLGAKGGAGIVRIPDRICKTAGGGLEGLGL